MNNNKKKICRQAMGGTLTVAAVIIADEKQPVKMKNTGVWSILESEKRQVVFLEPVIARLWNIKYSHVF